MSDEARSMARHGQGSHTVTEGRGAAVVADVVAPRCPGTRGPVLCADLQKVTYPPGPQFLHL